MMKIQLTARTSVCAAAVAALLAACNNKSEQVANYEVIPMPQEIAINQGEGFKLTDKTVIVTADDNDSIRGYARLLSEYIEQMTGNKLKISDAGDTSSSDAIILSKGLDNSNPEAYRLTVTPEHILIEGSTAAGTLYGVQTLRKSIPVQEKSNVTFPAATITDYPRFGYRGAHFDVSRHFFPVDSVKSFIDMLALHNINRMHWHLTDDQGWRVEIKSRPRLAEIASKRPGTVIGHNSGEYDSIPVEGYYTQDEIRDIVKYASDRNIVIVPEIDLPGHMVAALTAYPELGCTGGPYEVWRQWGVSEDLLCAGNDSTLKFIDDVLAEVVDLFPSELIHIGGDECPKVRWEECAKCQARIKELGLKDDQHSTAEQKLQSWVMEHASKFLADHGRRIIGWDEILEGGMSKDAVIMSWRGESGGIAGAKSGHDVIMTPNNYLYFDYYQTLDQKNEPIAIGGYVPVEKVYSYEPIPESLDSVEAKHIFGVQANLWTEYIPEFWNVEYMELPRMAALSEVQWTEPSKKNYEKFTKRIPQLIEQYDANGWIYAPHIFNVNPAMELDSDKHVVKVTLTTVDDAPVYFTLDGSEPTEQSNLYEGPVLLDKTCTIKAAAFRPTGRSKVWTDSVSFNLATARPIELLQGFSQQYKADGPQTLVNGRFGSLAFNTGSWMGFIDGDMEAVIDLGQPTKFSTAGFNSLVTTGDWIFDATDTKVDVSLDGTTWDNVVTEKIDVPSKNVNEIVPHRFTFPEVEARYVKITAKPLSKLPDWHAGKGKPAFLFVDEIVVE